jgi:hypothetical protein
MIVLSEYVACFDASYDQNTADNGTIVAGYISSIDQWAQWEIDWRLTLAEFDVPYFHMKEFISRKKAFKHPKWESENYRTIFLSKLIAITKQWAVASVGSSIKQRTFDFQNEFFELDPRYNPYVVCARDCAMHAKKFIRNDYQSDRPITYIFDQGDQGAGLLMREMEASALPSPVFRRSRPNPQLDKDDPPVIQLQACDLVAWEIRRGARDHSLGKKLRKSLQSIGSIPHRKWMDYRESDLVRFISLANIPLRPEWAHLRDVTTYQQFKSGGG